MSNPKRSIENDMEAAIKSVVEAVRTLIDVAVDDAMAKARAAEQRATPAPAPTSKLEDTKVFVPRLITIKEAAKLTSMSRAMINKLRAQGRFPSSVDLGERRVAFVRQEVQDWIDARIASRK